MPNPRETYISSSDGLTRRELSILAHLSNGRSGQEIANLESLAYTSVKWYIHQVYAKLGVNSRGEAIRCANDHGLLRVKGALTHDALDAPIAVKNNLPRQFTSFIGREKQIQQLHELVCAYPIVTLTGSGGTGKTRLALQAAETTLDDFPDGVWFVDLAPLSDPALLPLVAASALGIHGIARESALKTLRDFIGRKRLLLILDNCEHLIAPAAELVQALLKNCHGLHIFATSRETLGVPGERPLRCPPLDLPDPQARPSSQQIVSCEAVRLFAERAQAIIPEFQLDAASTALVLQICLRLDGIPLAIELAAARLRILSVAQIAARLENIFYLLTGGGRTALPRHKTLKAMVDWSYDLLSEPEQLLVCRLSVFEGWWRLEAAEAVCSDPGSAGSLAQEAILDLLSGLVDKSLLVVQTGSGGELRYRVLEMIRQYGHNRLLETNAAAALRERHLDYYRALSLRAEPYLRSKFGHQWVDLFEDEMPNLRLALDWAINGSVVKGLRLAGALYWFWFMTKHRLEGIDWLNRLLAAEQAGRAIRAEDEAAIIERSLASGKALIASSYTGILTGQDGRALVKEAYAIFEPLASVFPREAAYAFFLLDNNGNVLENQLERARSVGYVWLMGEIINQIAFQAIWSGDLVRAQKVTEDGMAIHEETGDPDGAGGLLWTQGSLQFMRGNLVAARELYIAGRAAHLQAGDLELESFSHRFPSWLALAQGRCTEAADHSQVELAKGQAMNVPFLIADALGWLGWAALASGDEEKALYYGLEALKLKGRTALNLLSVANYVLARLALARGELEQARIYLQEFVQHNYHNWPPVQLGIQLFGMLALAEGQPARAAVFFGAQAFLAANLMNVIPPPERAAYQAALAELHSQLDTPTLDAAWAAGQAMSTRQAIDYALEEKS